jgi:hypothetical protein
MVARVTPELVASSWPAALISAQVTRSPSRSMTAPALTLSSTTVAPL